MAARVAMTKTGQNRLSVIHEIQELSDFALNIQTF
jgi:hypothetical protein